MFPSHLDGARRARTRDRWRYRM